MRGGSGKEKGRKALAWTSFVLALLAGTAMTATFIGDMIVGMLDWMWPWMAPLVFVGVFISMAMDLFVDGEPNQVALYSALVLPTLALAAPGQMSAAVTDGVNNLRASVGDGLSSWLGLGSTSSLGVAAVCTVAALLVGRRVLAKSPGR